MKTLIITDFKACSHNGTLYVGTQFSTIARRYHKYFGDITLIARVEELDIVPSGHEETTDYIHDYISIKNLKFVFFNSFSNQLRKIISKYDLIILRCPSIIAFKSINIVKEFRKPYLSELMGDAWDAYWNHGLLGKLIAPFVFKRMQWVVSNGNYALYVTERFLQERYPCDGLTVTASNVLLEDVSEPVFERRIFSLKKKETEVLTLMTTAAVNVKYKGQEYVIKAIPALNKLGIRVRYVLVGGGDNSYLLSIAKKLDVIDQVEFVGRKTLPEVFSLLDMSDIYIQPSLQEGLPRSVIEALSRGCLVIGARTAGIPELIDEDYVVRKKNSQDIVNLVSKIYNMSENDKIVQCRRNFDKSKEYLSKVLDARRDMFFKNIIKDIVANEKKGC